MATARLIYSGARWGVYYANEINVVEASNNKTLPIGGNDSFTYTTIFEFKIPKDIVVSELNKLTFTLVTAGGSSLNYVGNLFSRSSENLFTSTNQAREAIKNTAEGWLGQSIATGSSSLTFTYNFDSTPAIFSNDHVLCLMVHSCYKDKDGYEDGAIRTGFGYKNIYHVQSTGEISYISHTKNIAPQTITIDNSIIAPGKTTILKWSGAIAGTANTISGYTIYYKDGSIPTTSSYTGKISSITEQCVVSPSSTRGQTRYFKIVSNSAISAGYDSDISTVNAALKTNQLPVVPSVAANKTILPSTGGTVVFSVITGSDSDFGQTRSVWYSTSNNSSKTKITGSSLSQEIKDSVTYYFWTYDELEYSENPFAITINLGNQPVITIGTIIETNYTSGGNTYTSNLSIPLSFNKEPKLLTYTLHYTIEGQTEQTISRQMSSLKLATTLNLNVNDLIKSEYNGSKISYYIDFIMIDNNDELSPLVKTSEYQISSAPDINKVYNNFEDENTSDESASYFYDKLRLYCDKDTEIIKIECRLSESIGPSYLLDSSHYLTDGYIDISFVSNLTQIKNLTIYIDFFNGSFTKTTDFNINAVKGYKLNSFSLSTSTLKPFSSPISGQATIGWPFAGEKIEEGCKCGFKYTYNNNSSEYVYEDAITKTSDSLALIYNYNHFITKNSKGEYGGKLCGNDIYFRGAYQIQIAMFIKTEYATFYSATSPLTINFEEQVQVENNNFSMGYIKDNGFISFSSDEPLREGIIPTFQLSFTQYTQATPTINILRSSDNVNWTNYYSYTPEDFNYFVNNHQQSFNIPTSAFPEISEIDNNEGALHFKVTIGVSSTLSESTPISVQARKFTSSEVSIKTITYEDNNIIKVSYSTIAGYTKGEGPTTSEVILIDSEGKKIGEPTKAFLNENKGKDFLIDINEIIFSRTDPLPSISSLQLKFVSKCQYNYNKSIILEKQTISSAFVKFSNAPTVSYRQNLVGINTSNIDNSSYASDSVLMIAQSSGKNYITLVGASGEGEILGRIDLSTGELSGFTINGGTW